MLTFHFQLIVVELSRNQLSLARENRKDELSAFPGLFLVITGLIWAYIILEAHIILEAQGMSGHELFSGSSWADNGPGTCEKQKPYIYFFQEDSFNLTSKIHCI